MNTQQKGILTLLRSAITGEKLSLPQEFSMEEADKLIQKQSLVPLAFQGAFNCGVSGKSERMELYRGQYFRYLLKSEQQMREVKRIFQAFEENGIDYLPLKGTVLKGLYPQPEMRAMGDADILIRMEQYGKIRQIMLSLGFSEKGESHHELVWYNKNLYLELHKCLFAATERDFYPYFGDGWGIAQKEAGCRYALTPEDTFAYLFTHMTKHYRGSGVGARHILDLYVYRRAYPQMEEARIEKAMAGTGLLTFYRNIRRLLDVWFADAESDERTDFITDYIFSGGNWGKMERVFESEAAKKSQTETRSKRILRAIFPPLEKMQYDYRILFRYPRLYPLFWIPRWIRGIFCRPREILRKFRLLGAVTEEAVDQRRQALHYVGLDYQE